MLTQLLADSTPIYIGDSGGSIKEENFLCLESNGEMIK